MTQKTRYFVLASFLVMAVGLGTGLVAYYNGNLGVAGAPSEMSYIPADATALAYADVRSIMNSEFRQKVREILPEGDAKADLANEIGLDIERDIDSVLAGYVGNVTGEGGLIIVRGRFDDDMIETKIVQHGGVAETYRSKRLLVAPQHAQPVPGPEGTPAVPMARDGKALVPAIAILEPGVLAIGDAASLRRGIDAAADKTDVTTNADLMRFVRDVQGTGNAWVVSKFDAMSQNANIPTEIKSRMPALQWVSASAHVNGGVSGMLRAEARDEKAASDLHAVLTGGLAAARMMSGQDQRLEGIINSVQVMGSGKSVSVTFALQPELLDLVFGAVGGRGGAAVR